MKHSAHVLDTMVAWNEWYNWLVASYSPATVAAYNSAFSMFMRTILKPVGEIGEADVTAWLQAFPYRSAKRRTYYQALVSAFGFFERRLYVLSNPVSHVRVPAVVEKVPRALNADELEHLRAAAAERSPLRGYYVDFLYYTGARLGESVQVRWTDLEDGHVVFRVTKGGRERRVPIAPKLRPILDALHDWTGDEPYLFPRSPGTCWGWIHTAANDAGLHGVHPHMIRSTFATMALVRGAKPHTVRELLGHQNIRTTMKYWAVSDEDREEAVGLL